MCERRLLLWSSDSEFTKWILVIIYYNTKQVTEPLNVSQKYLLRSDARADLPHTSIGPKGFLQSQLSVAGSI